MSGCIGRILHRVNNTGPLSFVVQQSVRHAGFFSHVSAESLWNSTSPTARRTGRGKRTKVRKREDLGRNKVMGEGTAGMLWPGLNARGTESEIRQRTAEEQQEYEHVIGEQRKGRGAFQRDKIMGWSGAHWGGVRLGAPEPIDGVAFDDFESIITNVQRVSHMNNKIGRVYSVRASVVVGNTNGVVGVSGCAASDIVAAVRQARVKAMKRLRYVERFEERTVYEDIYVNHHKTWMYIRQQPPAYGLRCHRAVADICKLIGIKDLYVKTFGAMTTLNLVKCFLKGLEQQETHQQRADRTGYNVVRCDPLRGDYPEVLAAPSGGEKQRRVEPHDEYRAYLDQQMLHHDYRRLEGRRASPFGKVVITNNRGKPVPPSRAVPAVLADIREHSL